MQNTHTIVIDPNCNDQIRNEGETGVDCGGPCPGCPNGQPCNTSADCNSSNCNLNHICASKLGDTNRYSIFTLFQQIPIAMIKLKMKVKQALIVEVHVQDVQMANLVTHQQIVIAAIVISTIFVPVSIEYAQT